MPESVLDAAAELADVFREVDKAAFATLGMHLFGSRNAPAQRFTKGESLEMQIDGRGKDARRRRAAEPLA